MEFYVSNTSDLNYMHFLNENGNLSAKDRDQMCKLAKGFRTEPSILLIVMAQTLASLSTLILLFLLYKDREVRRIMNIINLDLKIIVLTALIVHSVSNANAFGVYLFKLVLLVLDLNPCSYIWSGYACHWSQAVYALICARAFLTLHVVLLLERTYVTFINKRGRYGGFFGFVASAVILIYPVALQLRNINPTLFVNDRLYCSSLYTVIDTKLTNSTYSVIVFDCFITIGDFLLFAWNRYRIRKYKQHLVNFSLENSFILRQMQVSIWIIFPFSCVHSIIYFTQMYLYVVYSQEAESVSVVGGNFMYEVVNCGRIIGNFVLIGFLYLQSRYRRRQSNVVWASQENETDVYFRQFQLMIR